MQGGVPLGRDNATEMPNHPRLHFAKGGETNILSKLRLYLLIGYKEIALIATMRVGIEKRVANEAALTCIDTKLHSEVLHLIIIGLGSKVSVTIDEGIGPIDNLF